MFHEHEGPGAATTSPGATTWARGELSDHDEAGRTRARRGGRELAAVAAVTWVAALVLYDPVHEAWTSHQHLWLVPLLAVLALAGNRVRARLGRSRSERTVVFDATGAVLIGAALLIPPLLFPVVAIASAWRPDRLRLSLNAAIRTTAMSCGMLSYELATLAAADSGLPVDTVRVIGLLSAGAAYLVTEAVVHVRHLDLADGLGDDLEGLGQELVCRDAPGVALGLLVFALLAVSPVTALLAVPLVWLLVRSLRAQEEVLQSGIDDKTGLLTLQSFRVVAVGELARSRRHARDLIAVMLDLDHMKSVNTLRGHLAGEAVLASIGAVLRSSARAEDVVARFGGDEFCLLLPDTDLEGALVLVERLRLSVGETELLGDGDPLYRTASFGLTRLRVGDDLEALLERADSALRRAKAQGRDRLAVEL